MGADAVRLQRQRALEHLHGLGVVATLGQRGTKVRVGSPVSGSSATAFLNSAMAAGRSALLESATPSQLCASADCGPTCTAR